jgi:hypothetical protein
MKGASKVLNRLDDKLDYVKADRFLRQHVTGFSISLARTLMFFVYALVALIKLPYLIVRSIIEDVSDSKQ